MSVLLFVSFRLRVISKLEFFQLFECFFVILCYTFNQLYSMLDSLKIPIDLMDKLGLIKLKKLLTFSLRRKRAFVCF